MQPLSRVKPNAVTHWGESNTMSSRPKIAIKVAECIAEWAEIETSLGMFLGFLLHTNANTALAIYASLENRSAQFRMLDAAAASELPSDHYDAISALHAVHIRPAMRERDRLAHWCWGYSDDLPNDLLLAQPSDKTRGGVRANEAGMGGIPTVRTDYTVIYVITEGDLTRILERLRKTKDLIMYAASSVWQQNTPRGRAERLQQLANEPAIQAALIRQREARQKNQAAQQPSPPPEQSEKA